MKQTSKFLCTYSADVFGVCSALYELGGLVIMHDASGCNSTYTTHDEPRWYTMESLVYVSALTETEAIMGDDNKLIKDIIAVADEMSPRFIAIAGTPIPMMMGTDFTGIAHIIEKRTGIPTFGFETNGIGSYIEGAGMALELYAKRFCTTPIEKSKNKSVNLLGVTPLDFSITGNVEALSDFFEKNGYSVVSCWSMGSEPEQLAKAGEASVNIVASSSGLPLAKVLNKLYGTPYVVGLPIGKAAAKNLIQNAEKAIQTGENIIPVKAEKEKITSVKPVYIIGEPVFASELATCLTEDLKTENVRIISPFDNELNCGTYAESEDETFDLLKDAGTLIADPLYKRILPLNSDVKFIPFPHEAYSGRIYRSDIPMFIGEEIIPWLEKLL